MFADLHALEVVRVEPGLQPVHIVLGRGELLLVLLGEVVVYALGQRARAVDADGRQRGQPEAHGRCEAEIDDRDCDPAWDLDPAQSAHHGIEQQGDERGDDEYEDRVRDGGRELPDENDEERQADELNPARNRDRGVFRGHPEDRIARSGEISLRVRAERSRTLFTPVPERAIALARVRALSPRSGRRCGRLDLYPSRTLATVRSCPPVQICAGGSVSVRGESSSLPARAALRDMRNGLRSSFS